MKTIYIAAPFFNVAQLEIVELIESEISKCLFEINHYSPRSEGVLQAMTAAQRAAAAPKTFETNCTRILQCDAMLAVLDDKDTGTTWELGFAYAYRRLRADYRIMACSFKLPKINVMLDQCIDSTIYHKEDLKLMLRDYGMGQLKSHYGEAVQKVY